MDQTERQTVKAAADRVDALEWHGRLNQTADDKRALNEAERLKGLLAIIEKQDAAFKALEESFLSMRDRVSRTGWFNENFRPLAGQRMFEHGASVFEWCATQTRQARAGERLLDPPTPDEMKALNEKRAREAGIEDEV
jgi:hypothetical protein